jgi:hypothetical protein
MKKIKFNLSILLCLFTFPLFAKFNLADLRAGDVLLISLNCFECRMIESETNSAFSHSGVVVVDQNGQLKIAQSLGRLDLFTYEAFTKNKTPQSTLSVYRPKEFKNIKGLKLKKLELDMYNVFVEKFKNAPFDSKYLWNNFSTSGAELLYCSEFIAKYLDYFLSKKTIPFPITYQKHYDYWLQYFKGVVPEGELGNSPASFSRDERFEFVGTL